MTAKLITPKNLGGKARRIWREISTAYDLRVDEQRILEDACREIDWIERLEAEQGTSSLMVEGSMGQLVASPLITELRQHRALLAKLLGLLKLPDDEAASGTSTSARAAAAARWSRGA